VRRRIIIIAIVFVVVVGLITTILLLIQGPKETEVSLDDSGNLYIEYPEGLNITVPESWNPVVGTNALMGLTTKHPGLFDNAVSLSIEFVKLEDQSVGEYVSEEYPLYEPGEDENGDIVLSGPLSNLAFNSSQEGHFRGRVIEYGDGAFVAECIIEGSFNADLINDCGEIMQSLSLK